MSTFAPAPPLRLSWRPRPGGARRGDWWPGEVRPCGTVEDVGWFSDGVSVSRRPGRVDATWVDAAWQPTPRPSFVRVTATADVLTISVPAVWRAQLHFSWRGEHLLMSSDLRTLAHALSQTQPSPLGVATFLAHGRSGRGLVPSLYRDIWTLRPGFRVIVRGDHQMRCERNWTPEADDRYDTETLGSATIRLRRHLNELADSILASHDRVGCLFSGGVDSSLVAATLLRRAPKRVVLFNLASAFGTTAEANLRARFLTEFDTISHSVDLPDGAGLIRALRATNAVAALPVGSIFSHVFEEIIAVARHRDCDALTTGDGGDEVFAEREDLLVDLLDQRRRLLLAAAGHFALRNGERITGPLGRAVRTRRALRRGGLVLPGVGPEQVLLGKALAQMVADATAREAADMRDLWRDGWTLSGLGTWRRAASVPEWEPISAVAPGFSVLSPLIDETVVEVALRLRREDFVPLGCGDHTKRLLRHAALAWLPAEIAMRPKIGSADGELLRRMRAEEHSALLDLLGSETARRAGLHLPAALEDPNAPLWRGDRWIRAAALVAWFNSRTPRPSGTRQVANVARVGAPRAVRAAPPPARARRSTPHVLVLAALNIVAHLAPSRVAGQPGRTQTQGTPQDPGAIQDVLTDLARRSCKLPLVTGSSYVMHRALSWYLKLLGVPAKLVEGAGHEAGRRYGVDVGGAIVDVSSTEVPMTIPARQNIR